MRKFYAEMERGDSGYPKMDAPGLPMKSFADLFKRQCFLNGIYEPQQVADLWAKERVKLAERDAKMNARR